MGTINETAEFLCEAAASGASFGHTLTLGRQTLYLSRSDLERLGSRFHVQGAADAHDAFSEKFFNRFLGADEVASLDYSDYEGASVRHDMNTPIPPDLQERFDAVVDGGALEHVFNFPVALANCMKMVKLGGRLFVFTPANNQMGHGFYQFSPELFYRALSDANGFQVERMEAVEYKYLATEFGSKKKYSVNDPDIIRDRVTLENNHPVGLLVQAKKVRSVANLFESAPQQSDYAVIWSKGSVAPNGGRASTLHKLSKLLPLGIRRPLALIYHKHFTHSFRNRSAYAPAKSSGARALRR